MTSTDHATDLTGIVLAKGAHASCDDGTCLYEAYNLLRYGGWRGDDRPTDVSPILHEFGMRLNDLLGDQKRQELKRFLPQPDGVDPLAGTATDGLDEQRGYLALDWVIRSYIPTWLDLAGLKVEAETLRSLRRIVDLAAAEAAGPVVRDARSKADAAWDAAGDAARAAAGAADWAAAWAARAADWAARAARAAAGAADWADWADWAAWAARAAAWAARGAARAAWDAAWAALAPTVDKLQDSALALFAAMIRPDQTPEG